MENKKLKLTILESRSGGSAGLDKLGNCISIRKAAGTLSKAVMKHIGITKDSNVIIAKGEEDECYFAVLPFNSKLKGFAVRAVKAKTAVNVSSYSFGTKLLMNMLTDGIYTIAAKPVFQDGIDWYLLTKID